MYFVFAFFGFDFYVIALLEHFTDIKPASNHETKGMVVKLTDFPKWTVLVALSPMPE